jgi:hypothetical protein
VPTSLGGEEAGAEGAAASLEAGAAGAQEAGSAKKKARKARPADAPGQGVQAAPGTPAAAAAAAAANPAMMAMLGLPGGQVSGPLGAMGGDLSGGPGGPGAAGMLAPPPGMGLGGIGLPMGMPGMGAMLGAPGGGAGTTMGMDAAAGANPDGSVPHPPKPASAAKKTPKHRVAAAAAAAAAAAGSGDLLSMDMGLEGGAEGALMVPTFGGEDDDGMGGKDFSGLDHRRIIEAKVDFPVPDAYMSIDEWAAGKGSRLSLQAVTILKKWFCAPENWPNPYPSDEAKELLAREAGLSLVQVCNWLRNERKRVWLPLKRIAVEHATAAGMLPEFSAPAPASRPRPSLSRKSAGGGYGLAGMMGPDGTFDPLGQRAGIMVGEDGKLTTADGSSAVDLAMAAGMGGMGDDGGMGADLMSAAYGKKMSKGARSSGMGAGGKRKKSMGGVMGGVDPSVAQQMNLPMDLSAIAMPPSGLPFSAMMQQMQQGQGQPGGPGGPGGPFMQPPGAPFLPMNMGIGSMPPMPSMAPGFFLPPGFFPMLQMPFQGQGQPGPVPGPQGGPMPGAPPMPPQMMPQPGDHGQQNPGDSGSCLA